MKDKFVLDSSIWIEIERQNPVMIARTHELIEKNQICLIDIIAAEVLRGVKTQKDFQMLEDAFSAFTQLTSSWNKVAHLAFQLSKKGFHPPLTDLYIAQCIWENKKTLITQDRHFLQIAKFKAISIEFIKK